MAHLMAAGDKATADFIQFELKNKVKGKSLAITVVLEIFILVTGTCLQFFRCQLHII